MSDSVGRVGNMAPIDINNQEISSITLNGNTEIDTVEVNGQEVFSSVPTVIIDDFEDNSMSEYVFNEVGGNTGIQTNTVFEGSRAFRLENLGGADSTVTSQSGLDAYPTPGSTWRFYVRYSGDDGSPKMEFGKQNTSGGSQSYQFSITPSTFYTTASISISRDNSTITETQTSFMESNVWYEVEISWETNGDMEAKVYDSNENFIASTGLGNDTTYTTGGIAWGYGEIISADSSAFFDHCRFV